MRSRDANHSFTFTVSTITALLLYSSALFADEYFISYRCMVKNSLLYNEKLYVSKAMTKCQGKATRSLELERDDSKNLKQILLNNPDKFFLFLSTNGIFIENKDIIINGVDSSSTVITLKSQCFKVDFNDNFVKITPLK